MGSIAWGIGAVYFLTSPYSFKKYLSALIFLFLLSLWRPIDGAMLSWALIGLYFISLYGKSFFTKISLFFSLFIPFFFLPLLFFESNHPSYPYILLLAQITTFLTLFVFVYAIFRTKRKVLLPIVFYWGMYFSIFAPVRNKLKNWLFAGGLVSDSSYFDLFIKTSLSIFAELTFKVYVLHALVLLSLLVILFFRWRGCFFELRTKIKNFSYLFFIVPFLLSFLGAIVFKNSAPHYHYVGIALFSLFVFMGFILFWRDERATLWFLFSFLTVFNFLLYLSPITHSFEFDGGGQGSVSKVVEINCASVKASDLGALWVRDIYPYVNDKVPTKIWLLASLWNAPLNL